MEKHWNGALLEDIPTAWRFAQTVTWNGKSLLVDLISKTWQKGAKLTPAEMRALESQIERLPGLEKWFVKVPPRKTSSWIVVFLESPCYLRTSYPSGKAFAEWTCEA